LIEIQALQINRENGFFIHQLTAVTTRHN